MWWNGSQNEVLLTWALPRSAPSIWIICGLVNTPCVAYNDHVKSSKSSLGALCARRGDAVSFFTCYMTGDFKLWHVQVLFGEILGKINGQHACGLDRCSRFFMQRGVKLDDWFAVLNPGLQANIEVPAVAEAASPLHTHTHRANLNQIQVWWQEIVSRF